MLPLQAWWRLVPEVDAEAFFHTHFEEVCPPDQVAGRGIQACVRWIDSGRDAGVRLTASRKTTKSELELLIVEIDVPLGQRKPLNTILETEKLGIAFRDGTVPSVFPLRPNFPDEVPHSNIAFAGVPSSLCLFDLPSEEVLRILSPAMLIERIRWWLRETAHGRLHGEDQPLDPIFAGVARTVILPETSADLQSVPLIGFKRSDDDSFPILIEPQNVARNLGVPVDAPRFSCIVTQTSPVLHGRLRALPRNMGELIEVYAKKGVDLIPHFVEQFRKWLENASDRALFENQCLLVIATPIERSPGVVDAIAAKAFFTACDSRTLAKALGAVIEADNTLARPIVQTGLDHAAVNALGIEAAHVHMRFDRRLAEQASGFSTQDPPLKILQIGAGALGSQIALTAARSGVGTWTIADPDHLLPHNLARHALSRREVGMLKAEAIAYEIENLLGPGSAVGHGKDIQSLCGTNIIGPDFDIVIDASASVPVARWLAGYVKLTAPMVSAFVNPSGSDLVLLREGEGRSIKLDCLEMDYYWHLVCEPDLSEHLKVGDTIMPSGGCRRPSLKISQSRISAAAAQAVESIFAETAIPPKASIEVFRRTSEKMVRFHWVGSNYDEIDLDGWKIAVSRNVIEGIHDARSVAGKLETGGILVGAWDRHLRKGWIVAHQDPPPDSEHSPTGFVRGSVGVYRSLSAIEQTTAANLGYVGEWHTHPPGHSSQASSDDALLMRWIGSEVQYSDVPALMIVCGEDGARLYCRAVGCSAIV